MARLRHSEGAERIAVTNGLAALGAASFRAKTVVDVQSHVAMLDACTSKLRVQELTAIQQLASLIDKEKKADDVQIKLQERIEKVKEDLAGLGQHGPVRKRQPIDQKAIEKQEELANLKKQEEPSDLLLFKTLGAASALQHAAKNLTGARRGVAQARKQVTQSLEQLSEHDDNMQHLTLALKHLKTIKKNTTRYEYVRKINMLHVGRS